MVITLESITEKMGCDPFNPIRPVHEDPYYIDDATPSPYSILTDEELNFLIEMDKERLKNDKKAIVPSI